MRVLIITNVPNSYRIPLFNLLNQELSPKGISMRVVFGAKGYKRRKSIIDENEMLFEHLFLKSVTWRLFSYERYFFTYKGLIRQIRSYRPHKIVVVGYSLATFQVWLLSFFMPFTYMIWGGTIPNSPQAKSCLRTALRRIFLKRASGCIAYGTLAKEYFKSLGKAENKIAIAINTVDTDFFERETALHKSDDASDGDKHLTYVGYLSKRKNVLAVLKMIQKLSRTRKGIILDIIGDGDQKSTLQDYVKTNNMGHLIVFHGFKQKNELPHFLAMSSCFLFQTDFDIWGLVLNEAMACGLPCIASINAGATHDLIRHGENGFAVNFENSDHACQIVDSILDDPLYAKKIGENAQDFIRRNATLKNSIVGFLEALENS